MLLEIVNRFSPLKQVLEGRSMGRVSDTQLSGSCENDRNHSFLITQEEVFQCLVSSGTCLHLPNSSYSQRNTPV